MLTAKANADTSLVGFAVDGVEVTLDVDGTYSFTASKDKYEIHATFGQRQKWIADLKPLAKIQQLWYGLEVGSLVQWIR